MSNGASARRRQPRLPIEVRRQQVLDAALRLIDRQGYGAATMEAIAEETGVAKTVVYAAYPNRGELLRALLEREETSALQQLAEAMPPTPVDGDPDEALMAWVRRLAQAVADAPTPWRLMLLPAAETPDVVREHVDAGRRLALAQVRTLIEHGISSRPALRHLDADLVARAVLAAAEECGRLILTDPEEYPPDRLARFARDVLAVLAGPPGGEVAP